MWARFVGGPQGAGGGMGWYLLQALARLRKLAVCDLVKTEFE